MLSLDLSRKSIPIWTRIAYAKQWFIGLDFEIFYSFNSGLYPTLSYANDAWLNNNIFLKFLVL